MRKVFNNKILLFIVAILLLANIAIVFYFVNQRDPDRHSGKPDRQRSPITEFLQKEIGFSTQQLDEFEKTRQKHRQLMRPLFEEIKAAKVQFYGLLTNPSVPDSTLDAAAKKIGDKQLQIDMQTFRNFNEIRTLCTPEQQPKYDSLIVNEITKMWFSPWKGNGRPQRDSTKK